MARKPPVLVALLALLALGAAPAAADAATFSIASVAPAEVTEGMTASVIVTRDAPADHATHVQVDGLPAERGVFFAPGATKQTVPVHSDFNDVVEPARVLDLSLSHPSAGDDVASGTTRLVVHDDDVEFAEDELSAFESEGFVLLPLRRLDAARALPIYLRYVQGTTTPADLLPSSPNRLTLPAGQLNPTVRVGIVRDNLAEPDETFTVLLNPPSDHPPVTVTILNSDRVAPTPVVALPARPALRSLLPLALRADEAATARVDLLADPALKRRLGGRRRLATAAIRLSTTPTSLRLHLDPALLRRLRDRARVRVVLRVRAVDAAGNQRTMLRRFTLTP